MAKGYSVGFGEDEQRFSDLVLGYVDSTDIGYPFRELTLTKTDTIQVGSVIASDGSEAAAAADAFGVFVRAGLNISLKDLEAGEEFTGVVVVDAATLNRYRIFYSNGDAIDDAGAAALEAKGIKVTDKLLKTS